MIQLIQRADLFSEKKALKDNSGSCSYRQLIQRSAHVASCLLEEKSDLHESRVAFLLDPGIDYAYFQWGIWRAGGVAVPLCVKHPLPSLEYVIDDTQAEKIIYSPAYEDVLKPLIKKNPQKYICTSAFARNDVSELPYITTERRAMILYTSGTTGQPKGVVTTHANIEAQIKALVESWEWVDHDHILNILPMHHVHGIINVLSCALWSGACCEFLPRFDADQVFSSFEKGEINLFMAVPTIYHKLIGVYENFSAERQNNLTEIMRKFRLMVSGSAALPVSVLEKWQKISGHTLLERYGMTEIGMAVSNPYHGERRPGHIGKPLPGVNVRLVEEDGTIINSASNPGEIQVKGENVFLEYFNRKEATKESFTDDGWFKTGDIACIEDGYIKILGRNSVDIIKSGGYKISALEIEEVLRKHVNINDCGVVGVPDEEWGELIVAGLVLSGDVDEKELNSWLRERLPAYKVPRKYLLLEDLPRNAMGKVTKKELKSMFDR